MYLTNQTTLAYPAGIYAIMPEKYCLTAVDGFCAPSDPPPYDAS